MPPHRAAAVADWPVASPGLWFPDGRVVDTPGLTRAPIAEDIQVLGTYVFLNMATKGYYTWMLRLAAIAGVGGVILLIRIIG